jgi:tetratricopeptide (TPR) repeat protein
MKKALLITLFAIMFGSLATQAQGSGTLGHKPVQANAAAPQTSSMTLWQARRTVVAVLKSGSTYPVKSISGIKITESTIEFNVDSTFYDGIALANGYAACFLGKSVVNLRSLGTLSAAMPPWKRPRRFYSLFLNGQDLWAATLPMSTMLSAKFNCNKNLNILGIFAFDTDAHAQNFVDAMNRLSDFARGGDVAQAAEWRDFQLKAAAWRSLAVKPVISEEVRRHRLLAENAVNEKQFNDAIDEYEAGLDINTCWPEGHFNAALIYAELKQYSDAIRHMRAYLELVPDAPDAQAARDQMIIWDAEAKKAN